ncbi:MAG TPA: glycosyltransferase family 1 protein, partial [Burkholderiales bacterium]|nr:glycosyltransferase family 1 protein [Burkholderiales bacterium]
LNGVSLTVRRAVDYLRERGHTVEVVRPRQAADGSDGGGDDDLLMPGMGLPVYPGVQFGFPAARRLEARWEERRPDVVHVATEGPLGWSALKAAAALGISATTDYRTHFHRYSGHYGIGWLAHPIEAYLRAFHNRAHMTFVSTAALRRDLASRGYRNVAQVGRGIDTELFNPQRRSAPLRSQWGLRADDLAVIYVGRIAPEKNLDLAVRAFDRIRVARGDARMIWVGDGPARARLEKRNPDHIFTGVQRGAELATHYASGDLFLFPSLTETFGNVTLEALASGLAVTAFAEGAASQHAVDGVSARLVEFGAEEAFVEAAAKLAADPAMIARLRRRAPLAVSALTWPAVLSAFERHLLASAHGYRLYANALAAG